MPKSRGRPSSGKPKDKSRAKARARAGRPDQLDRLPSGITLVQLDMMGQLASRWDALPREPSCPGMLLVHIDGSYECHGPDCPGETAIYHSDEAHDPCRAQPNIAACQPCADCAGHPAK